MFANVLRFNRELNSSPHPLKENHMADLFRLSASAAAAQIREGKLTSEALVRSCLERIDSRESQVKAWVHLDRDFALAQARECDKSASRGPIRGVPFAAKDIMDTADLPTEYGSPIYKGNRPAADAACVALSRAAGGVLLGKTVTTEFASRSPLGTRRIRTTPCIRPAVPPAAPPPRSAT
jgi:Asp-tRNA(Asn)/Glu-tRNA(Gln) amidotransferase A subunit family amidase